MKPFKPKKGAPSKDLDAQLTKKTGANYGERREWSDAVNAALGRMRDAVRAGREEAASEHGEEANRLYLMGPGGYKREKASKLKDTTKTEQQ